MALEAHHAAARKIVLAVHRDLEQLETGRDVSLELQSQISQHLNALARELHELERLLPNEGASRRSVWRRKIVELQEESASQRAALARFTTVARQQQREAEERSALFDRRRQNGDQHAISMDSLLKENTGIRQADSQLDALTGNAYAALASLGQQRSSLKVRMRQKTEATFPLPIFRRALRDREGGLW